MNTDRHLGVGPLRHARERAWTRWIRRGDAIRARHAANPGSGPWDAEPDAYLVAEALALYVRLGHVILDRERAIDYGRRSILNPASVRRGIAAGQIAFDWSR